MRISPHWGETVIYFYCPFVFFTSINFGFKESVLFADFNALIWEFANGI